MTQQKKPAKPAKKKTTKGATKKPAAKAAKVRKTGKPTVKPKPQTPAVDPGVMPAFPSEAQQRAADRGREANELKELTSLSEAVKSQYGRLTAREQAFVEAYITMRSAEPAAVAAGYSQTYARSHAGRLLNKPAIRAVIDEINARNLDALGITDAVIKEGLFTEARTAFESSSRVSAWIALAKMHKMFPGKEVKHSLASPLEQALREALNAIDGAGTGLPRPEPADGRRAAG